MRVKLKNFNKIHGGQINIYNKKFQITLKIILKKRDQLTPLRSIKCTDITNKMKLPISTIQTCMIHNHKFINSK